jgi:hypothetical protein
MKRWVLKAENEGKIASVPSMTSTGRKFMGYYTDGHDTSESTTRVQYPNPAC